MENLGTVAHKKDGEIRIETIFLFYLILIFIR